MTLLGGSSTFFYCFLAGIHNVNILFDVDPCHFLVVFMKYVSYGGSWGLDHPFTIIDRYESEAVSPDLCCGLI